jgi:hypothetical protein
MSKVATVDDVSELLFATTPPTVASPLVGTVAISTESVVHGRGLIATRAICVGECLFVTPPTVSAPLKDVLRLSHSTSTSLEQVAETILLKHMKRALRSKSRQQAASFMLLTSGAEQDDSALPSTEECLQLCLGQTEPSHVWWKEPVSDQTLLEIARHNAFGPDFHNYAQMEVNTSSNTYQRILGLYPLAAIINHSCQPNAVRVFSGELMIVHACVAIKAGEEIVWSYIPPTQSFLTRQALLSGKFDFTCQCRRCLVEGKLGSLNDQLDAQLGEINQPNLRWSRNNVEPFIKFLEQTLVPFNNEMRHFLRTSYLNVYLNYINASLLHEKVFDKEVSNLVLQLHLALSVSHNACTEHLSILHLGYDMAANKSFWIEQLKRAHMTRYGPMGQDLQQVRQSMQHTKGILRSLEGMQRRQWGFL